MADRVGFEPTVPFSTSVFKTDAIDHSTTYPMVFMERGVKVAPGAGLEPATFPLTAGCKLPIVLSGIFYLLH